jgi:N-acetylglutamate synthase-like GNAT family acetyltransferase
MDRGKNPTWSIRRATTGDREGIAELQERLHRPSRTDSATLEYFVAECDHKIVGCAAVRKQNRLGYLYGLVVDKPWRRKGLGHSLTQKRLDWLRDEDTLSVYVLAMFWNIKFFKKHGFTLANKGKAHGLAELHSDFDDRWSSRSALLFLGFSSRTLPPQGVKTRR